MEVDLSRFCVNQVRVDVLQEYTRRVIIVIAVLVFWIVCLTICVVWTIVVVTSDCQAPHEVDFSATPHSGS